MTQYVQESLGAQYSNEVVESVTRDMMKEGMAIVSRLPDVGKANAFQIVINVNGWIILYFNCQRKTKTPENIELMIHKAEKMLSVHNK